MKKTGALLLAAGIFLLAQAQSFAANDIMLGDTRFNKIKSDTAAPPPYAAKNIYVGKGREQKKPDIIVLFYSPAPLEINSASEEIISGTKPIGDTIGRVKKETDHFVVSMLGKTREKGWIYSLLKMQQHKIAGTQCAQLYIRIPEPKNPAEAIKQYDNKYFDIFANLKTPSVKDSQNKVLPKTYRIKAGGKSLVLKYSRFMGKDDGINYYYPMNQAIKDSDFNVRVNYLKGKISAESLIQAFREDREHTEGFREDTLEQSGNSAIYMHCAKMTDGRQEYMQYSITKIETSRKAAKTMEIIEIFPLNDSVDIDKKIKSLNTKYISYFKENPIPELIEENMGTLPESLGYKYMFFEYGIPKNK